MQPPTKIWQIAKPIDPQSSQDLAGLPPILQQILFNRGVRTPEEAGVFINALPPAGSDPFNLLGLPGAVDRIQYALQHQEKIVIYGDYDADGVTATALLTLMLKSLGAEATGYIPNRFDEGYGLNNEALLALKDGGAGLVITVDCGIRSLEEASLARRVGLDLIITDHHHPGDEIPQAVAVINPKQAGCPYPDKNLAGVGLAYKLAVGLLNKLGMGRQTTFEAAEYLDLVALGTVADMATLLGENRALVKQGIKEIQKAQRQGVLSLVGVAGIQSAAVTSTDIGFFLGPRLNASGRLETALDSLNLLMTRDVQEAGFLSQKLNNQNRERQELTHKIQELATEQVASRDPDALLLFAVHPDFNPGVVGLAASRLCERFYRPAIVGHQNDEYVRASCRSIPEFHITRALDECASLLERHGGHAAAAGFTVKNENLPALIEALNQITERELGGMVLQPKIYADLSLELKELKSTVIQMIDMVQPTGTGNPQVLFASKDVKVMRAWTVGKDAAHLKLTVTDGLIVFDCIGFRLGHLKEQLPSNIDILYTFEVNEYNGKKNFQLNLKDIKPSSA